MSLFHKNPETVKCDECKHIIEKEDAQCVITKDIYSPSYILTSSNYYCPMHKKPYSRIVDRIGESYYAELEVSEDGTPVGYTKINATGSGIEINHSKTNEIFNSVARNLQEYQKSVQIKRRSPRPKKSTK